MEGKEQEAKGIVKSVKMDGTACCIVVETALGEQEVWFDILPPVKPEYCKKGKKCSFKYTQVEGHRNSVLTFIQCASDGFSGNQGFSNQGYQKPAYPQKEEGNLVNQAMMRMNATKCASQVYMGTGMEVEFKALTDEIITFIEKGIWVTKEVVKGNNAKPNQTQGSIPEESFPNY